MITDVKVGNRRLRVGDTVKVIGERGLYEIREFPEDSRFVWLFGGKPGRAPGWHAVTLDRIGVRKAMAS